MLGGNPRLHDALHLGYGLVHGQVIHVGVEDGVPVQLGYFLHTHYLVSLRGKHTAHGLNNQLEVS